MKQFFKFMFASMLGFLITIFLTVLIFAGIIGAVISSSKKPSEAKINENTVLVLKLDEAIQDRGSNNPFENFDLSTFESKSPIGLREVIGSIDKAAKDDRIKGIYLKVASLQTNRANLEEIRRSLVKFKESGKFIVSYSENYSQGIYYLSSVADEIYLNPVGDFTFKGLSAQIMFFKDALSRLEIDMQIIRHGKFKSAVEPFIREDMSDANRKQTTALVNSIWEKQLAEISKARGISIELLNEIADGLKIRKAEDALKYNFVDGLKYEDEVEELLKLKTNTEEDKKLETVALNELMKLKKVKSAEKSDTISDTTNVIKELFNSKNKVAIIYAEGEIVSGKSREGTMGSETIAEAIKKARTDDKVKSIVLRVNSPGGSALASDVIWREMVLAKAEKPVIVSMGGVAASGGYYISCAADKIFAEHSTITGSIGVFGVVPNLKGLFNKKMGITLDQANTNLYADGLSGFRPLAETEREAIQEMIEVIYDDFTLKVSQGRNMTQAEVDSIGQGRVWTGELAKKIGLVDEIGGIDAAIAEAVRLAELDDYKIMELPEQKDPFEKLMKELSTEVRIQLFGTEFGKAEKYYGNIKQVLSTNGIYTRLPVEIIID